MRVALLGGTVFIGRAILDALLGAGHDVVVIHRGEHEPPDLPDVRHLHCDRRRLGDIAADLVAFDPEVFVDTGAASAANTEPVIAAIPAGARPVVLSSIDVYEAYGQLHQGGHAQPMPITETSPVRSERYPYRGRVPGMDDYEKLDVEERYLDRGATVLRLPIVYGPHDYQRREEFILRRVRHGRDRIPIGTANGLLSRGFVHELARGVAGAVATPTVAGEVFNLCEATTTTTHGWADAILAASGREAELVRVPDDRLPADLELTAPMSQHLLVVPAKAERLLGWVHTDPASCMADSVAWHLEHPPEDDSDDFTADDEALAAALPAQG